MVAIFSVVALGCGSDTADESEGQANSADVSAALNRLAAVWEAKLDECGCQGTGVRTCSVTTNADVSKVNACADTIEGMDCAAFASGDYRQLCQDPPCYFSTGWC